MQYIYSKHWVHASGRHSVAARARIFRYLPRYSQFGGVLGKRFVSEVTFRFEVAYLDIISHEAVGVYNMQVDECVFEETMAVQAMITSHAVGDDNSAAGRTHMLEIQHLNELDDDVLFTASDSLSEPTRWLMDEE